MNRAGRSAGTFLKAAWRHIENAVNRFGDHKLTDWAAALTYYSMLSVFPALLVLVSVVGLLGQPATSGLIDNFQSLAPGPAREITVSAIRGLQSNDTAAGILLIGGLVTALYSASSYIGSFIRAAGVITGFGENRRFYETIPLRIGLTLLLMLLTLGAGLAIVISGPIADDVARVLGLSDSGAGGWDLFKWPIVILMAVAVLAILYNFGPDYDQRKLRLITPGIVLAVMLWIILSIGFNFYVGSFARYNRTYGSLAGVIVFLIWLWLSNIAVLLGLELDAEMRRFRKLHGRGPRWFFRR